MYEINRKSVERSSVREKEKRKNIGMLTTQLRIQESLQVK
jgi:hypothetical protein